MSERERERGSERVSVCLDMFSFNVISRLFHPGRKESNTSNKYLVEYGKYD